MRSILIILLALGAVEGGAWWWMHPAPAGLGQPVLAYRHGGINAETLKTEKLKEDRPSAPSSSSSQKSEISNQQSSIVNPSSSPSSSPIQNPEFKIHNSPPSSSYTLLPEVASRSIPSLRCSAGTAACIERDDGAIIHLAFFEWNRSDSTNVLEAFKHLPDECMGSIGMTLIANHPPRTYVVRNQETVGLDRRAGPLIANGVNRERNVKDITQEPASADAKASPSPSNPQSSISSIQNPKSNIQNFSSPSTISFDHTTFRDPAGVVVHAFKGTWVSGATDLLGPGVRGGVEQWRQIRWKSALKRFRPAYARVAQGAVRGISNPDLAWQAFENAMLVDLVMER